MKSRTFLPQKLDVGVFIESAEVLEGQIPVADLARLAEDLFEQADLAALGPVTWRAQGRLVKQRVGEPQKWLDLEASARLPWECQRCLHAVELPIEVQRSIRFVVDEAAAAELDADCDDDVLAMSRTFDLLELIEDELIMARPLVPRHEQCPTDVERLMKSDDLVDPQGASAVAEVEDKPHPFAALAALKNKNPKS